MAIAVIGGARCDSSIAELAYDIGRTIAQRGAVLITGGRTGVMEAACRGARDAGGLSVGILPGYDSAEANDAVDIAITTGMGHLRNGLVVSSAAAVIAVGGEWGTLTEIGFARTIGRPVVGVRTWTLEHHDASGLDIERVHTADEAVQRAFELGKQ